MALTEAQILKLLDLCAEVTVVEPSEAFPYRVTRRSSGYSQDKELGQLQARLSIMLEMTRNKQ